MRLALQFAQCRGKDFCLSGNPQLLGPRHLTNRWQDSSPGVVEVIGGTLVGFSQQVQSLENCTAIPAIYGFSVAS